MEQNVFQKNLQALQEFNPRLGQAMATLQDIPAIQIQKAPSGEWDISCQFNDGTASSYYGGRSPLEQAKEQIASLKLKNPRIVIFLGVGLGYHLLEYARNPHPLNQIIIIIEAYAHVLHKAFQANDLTPLIRSRRVLWFTGDDVGQLNLFLGEVFSSPNLLTFANAIEYIPLGHALKMSPRFYESVQKSIPQAIGHQFNRYFSDPFDAYRGMENTFQNLPSLLSMPSFEKARDSFKGKPGILIASGPSLSKSLLVLKEVQDRAVLVACPSAVPALLRNGIRPHVWLNIERDENQGKFFEDLPGSPDHVFVGTPLVHPRCYTGNRGLNSFVTGTSLLAHWLPFPGSRTEFGHSSAHAAFRMLEHMGCGPLFLLGQDLSYEGEASHAAGVWDESAHFMKEVATKGEKTMEVEGNDGRPVRTNLFWHTYLKTFTEQILSRHSGKVYNVIPASSGARIEGTERLDPEKLGSTLAPDRLQVFSDLQKILTAPSKEEAEAQRQILLAKIDRTLEMLRHVEADLNSFSLECKRFQFSTEVGLKKWDLAKPLYEEFMERVQAFISRHMTDPGHVQDQDTYQNFFLPVIQGPRIRFLIEFFTNAEDFSGDFREIMRKIEILFHMTKDEAHWARLCIPLLEKCRLELEKAG